MQLVIKAIILLASCFAFGIVHADSLLTQPTEAAQQAFPGEFRDCQNCPLMIPIPGNNFAVGKFDITFEEWDACFADGGCNGYKPKDNGWGRGNLPVFNVSWNDVQTYLHWLSEKSGKSYRLPSEQEWEIAARAGSTSNYYWGNDAGINNANCNGCGSKWDRIASPVGSFKPNAYGLYDMLGNVWQWTDGCNENDCSKRGLRGGSWFYFPLVIQVGTKNAAEVTRRFYDIGFRVALSLK